MPRKRGGDPATEMDALRARAEEAEEMLRAIRTGEVDALVVATPEGDRIFTLEGSETPYRIILENINEGAVTLNAEGMILYANSYFLRMLGAAPGKIVGTPLQGLLAPEHRERFRVLLRKGLKAGAKEESVLLTMRKQSLPVSLSLNPLPAGQAAQVSMIITDLSERKEAEEKLRDAYGELEQRVRERTAELAKTNESLLYEIDERTRAEEDRESLITDLEAAVKELEGFTYSISHDLRAPVRHIAGFSEILREEAWNTLSEPHRKHLATIVHAAGRLGVMIDELLQFSHMGRSEVRRTMVDVGALIARSKEELKPEMDGRDIEWVIGDLPKVPGDPSMLQLAVSNLISNAVKFTRNRTHTRIEIRQIEEPDRHIIAIADNGVGFDMAYSDKLFRVFHRLHNQRDFEGTGIGLANVQRIVQKHGGQVWAESRPGEGSTFFFSLPKTRKPGTKRHQTSRTKKGKP